jgi:hypothetical protein
MPISVRIELKQRQIDHILRSPNGITGRNMMRRANKVQRHAQRNVHSRTGRLARSINVRRAYFLGAPGAEIYTGLSYAHFVHDGTRGPIRARAGGYLKFEISGQTIYAKQVRGQSANPFLAKALRSAL